MRSSPRRATTGRPPTRSSPAISSIAAMPDRRTGAPFANWCSGRSARSAERPESGRAAVLGLAEDEPELLELFGAASRAGAAVPRRRSSGACRIRARMAARGAVAARRRSRVAGAARAGAARPSGQRRPRLARRCSGQIRPARADAAQPLGHSPAARQPRRRSSGLRGGPRRGPGRGQPADRARLRACRRRARFSIFAPAPAARRLPWPPRRHDATILATDSNRARLSKLGAARRARRSDDRNPAAQSAAGTRGACRLARIRRPRPGRRALLGKRHVAAQSRRALAPDAGAARPRSSRSSSGLLDIAAELVRPGGRLVYAVCSLLSREGAGQIDRFLERHSSWISEESPIAGGRADGAGRLLTPGHDRTDGFFVARLRRPC